MSVTDSNTSRQEKQEFSARSRQGIVWLFGSQGFEQVLQLMMSMILARLLTPADYGLIGMATVVIGFVGRFSNFGTGMAIIQKRELDDTQLSSVFWFNVAIGFGFMCLLVLGAPLTARFFSEPALIPVMVAMALTMPFQAFGIVHDSLLRRHMQFDRYVIRNLSSIAISGVFGVLVALAGGGVWALVAQQVSQPLIMTVILWLVMPWRPKLHFRKQDVSSIGQFTTGAVGFNILNYVSRNADYLLIGRFLGPTALGFYTLAYRLMLYPVRNLSGVASQSLFPVFSRLQDDEDRLSKAFIRASQYISVIGFPLMIGLALNAETVLAVFYGPQWSQAATVLTLLSLVGVYQPIVSLYGTVLWSKGIVQWQVRVSAIKTAVTVAGFAIGLRWGINGVAMSYLITETIMTVILLPIMFRKCGTRLDDFLRAISRPAGATVVMALAILAFRIWAAGYLSVTLGPLLTLTVNVAVGALVYLSVLYLAGGTLRNELLRDIRIGLSLKKRKNTNDTAKVSTNSTPGSP